jgi:hypothetical protein
VKIYPLRVFLFKIVELENALCNQNKLLCRVFCENKKLNLELENSFFEIASLRLVHDDMSAKPCDSWKMTMVNSVVQVNIRVPNWNLESSKLVPYC